MECEFCKKILSSLSSLNNHKLTAKYCLKIQNKTVTEKFKCTYCDKNFTAKNTLISHTKICKDINIIIHTKDKDIIIAKQESIIENYKKQEDTYKEQLQKQ